MLKITDRGFHYTRSENTDIRKRFRKIERDRERQALEAQRRAEEEAGAAAALELEQKAKVRSIKK